MAQELHRRADGARGTPIKGGTRKGVTPTRRPNSVSGASGAGVDRGRDVPQIQYRGIGGGGSRTGSLGAGPRTQSSHWARQDMSKDASIYRDSKQCV